MAIWTKSEGAYIKITFTESLTYAVDGNQSHFTVSWQEYGMVPGEPIHVETTYPIINTSGIPDWKTPERGIWALQQAGVYATSTGLGWGVPNNKEEWLNNSSGKMATISDGYTHRGYYKTNNIDAICFIDKSSGGYIQPALISTDLNAISYSADSGGPWTHNVSFTYLGLTWYYNYGEHGFNGMSIINKTGAVLQTFLGEHDDELILEMQPLQRFHNAIGQITVAYDGAGTLQGDGGAVEAFSVSFTPQDLAPKNNPHHSEHLEIVSVSATGSLPLVTYYNTRSSHEHLEIVSVTASGTLTHIDDL